MNKACYIIGTDTGVGKTIVTGAMAAYLKKQGRDVGVMKPFESACNDAQFLQKMSESFDPMEQINPYHFEEALAPAVAAQFRRYSTLALALQDSWQREMPHPIRPVSLADYIAARIDVSTQVKQEVLGEPTAFRRLEFLLSVLQKENQSLGQRLLLHRRHKLHGLGAGN